MKLLNEANNGVLFSANQLQTIRNIYANSSFSNIVTKNDDEKKLVSNLLRLTHKSNNAHSAYLVLQAASKGPDTSSNYLLFFISDIPSSYVDRYSNKIAAVLNFLEQKQIDYTPGKIDEYLKNSDLYTRDDKDFEYTIKAFDAVIYKKSKYFTDNPVLVPLKGKRLITRFFGKNDIEYKYNDTNNLALVPIDQKYFFKNLTVSTTSNIIPAGINGTDDTARTIWNYMEIWTNSTDRDLDSEATTNKIRERNKSVQNNLNKAKQIMQKYQMSDADVKELSGIMSELSR